MISRNALREQFGKRLAETRARKGMSGRQLAPFVGVQQSAVSKIERGRLIPSREYLEKFARALKLSAQERGEIFTLADSLLQRTHRVQLGREGEFTRIQRLVSSLDYAELRMLQVSVVPGPLQTPAYARAIFFGAPPSRREHPDLDRDLDAALAERRKQSTRLDDPRRRLSFLIHESALRTRTCAPRAMAAQLRHLGDLSQDGKADLGLIPSSLEYQKLGLEPPQNSFDLYDDKLLAVDIYAGWLNFWDESMIADYRAYFDRLRAVAAVGEAFRRELDRIARDSE